MSKNNQYLNKTLKPLFFMKKQYSLETLVNSSNVSLIYQYISQFLLHYLKLCQKIVKEIITQIVYLFIFYN